MFLYGLFNNTVSVPEAVSGPDVVSGPDAVNGLDAVNGPDAVSGADAIYVTFTALTDVAMKNALVWDVAPCRLVEI